MLINMTYSFESMKPFTLTIVISVLFILNFLFLIGCDRVEESSGNGFVAGLINQHMEAEADYRERYRPQYHFTPRIHWMNDPNGLVYFNGEYHLFYQYNPFASRWGYMSWGHAVSTDMLHWEHRPVAIPYGKEQEEGIFSGSAVVDHENTSGFGDGSMPPLVAVYTSHYTRDDGSTWQAQSLAYSTDGGNTFTKYVENPVLEFDDPDFRDPNVSWIEEMGRWLMVVALPTQRKVQFYASDNLIDWEFLSDFGPAGATGGIWECPDMFKLPVDGDPDNLRWVLHVDLNPGSVAGGSGSQYFVGEWNGTHFIPESPAAGEEPLWVDYGTDFYAAITWNNIPAEDGRRLWVGWSNNWSYANEIPTSPWRSMQSIPRSLHLETIDNEIRLIQQPVRELETLRSSHIQLSNISIQDERLTLDEFGVQGSAYELLLQAEPANAETFGIKVRTGENEETVIIYNIVNGKLKLDRTRSGDTEFSERFSGSYEAPVSLEDGKLRLHLFVDWSSVELFVNDGKIVLTTRIFPDPESTGIVLFSEGGDVVVNQLDLWELATVWD
jgi:fructan beta-fructosidase